MTEDIVQSDSQSIDMQLDKIGKTIEPAVKQTTVTSDERQHDATSA